VARPSDVGRATVPGMSKEAEQCEICGKLSDAETSYSKYGSPDDDRPLPPEASRLVPEEPASGCHAERDHVKRCPLCGTFYRYLSSYEYLVNGSEDEEELRRITPEEAARLLARSQTE
jgi:hypothetical protein